MNTFRKWNNKPIEDNGCYMSEDAKGFYRAFKNYLKRVFPEATLTGFKPNHYDFSGFLTFPNGVNIYISHSIDRYKCRVDFNENGALRGVLYRTAKSVKDYTGGPNNFSSIFDLKENVKSLVFEENVKRLGSFEERRSEKAM